MSLTGWPLMLTAILFVVAAPIGTYLLWNRARGPRVVRMASRFVMIGVCQLMAIVLCGIVINNHFQFYGSWDDVLGNTGGPGVIIHENAAGQTTDAGRNDKLIPKGGGRGLHARIRPDGPTQPFAPAGDANVVTTSFVGPKTGLGGANDVYVWLPPQYNDPAYAKTDFPVVMLFPGFPGTPQTWFGNMAGQKELARMLQQDPTTTPFVLVAVNITPEKGVNTNCTDIPNGPQVATYITEDVRPMIERTFRVTTERTGWGMMGYSEGGLCAGKLLVQYPQYFGAAVQMSGDIRPDGVVGHYGRDVVDANSTLWMLQHRKPTQPISLLAAASKEDGSTLVDAEALQAAAPDYVDVLRKDLGKHNTGVWKSWLPQAYAWLSQQLDPAKPQS
jgi:enterochelin esterase-like enzyme